MDHETYTFTPSLQSYPTRVSMPEVNRRIQKLEENNYVICENDFPYIERFLESSFFEESRKEELKKHLGENYGKYLFDHIFESHPSIPVFLNGVPVKENDEMIYIPSEEIKQFLLFGTIKKSRKDDFS